MCVGYKTLLFILIAMIISCSNEEEEESQCNGDRTYTIRISESQFPRYDWNGPKKVDEVKVVTTNDNVEIWKLIEDSQKIILPVVHGSEDNGTRSSGSNLELKIGTEYQVVIAEGSTSCRLIFIL